MRTVNYHPGEWLYRRTVYGPERRTVRRDNPNVETAGAWHLIGLSLALLCAVHWWVG